MALLETLQDDWSSGTIDPVRWPDISNATYVTYNAGAGTLQVVTPSPGTQYNFAQTGLIYDFTGSYLYAKVIAAAQSPSGTGSQETYILVSKDTNNQVYIYRNGVNLYRGIKTAGVTTEVLITSSFSAVTHAWWRIRHQASDDKFYYATSPDGITWTEVATGVTRPWAITATRATLMVGKFTSTDPQGTGTFDNININGYPTPDGIGAAVTLDAPTAAFDTASLPADGITAAVALDAPDAAFTSDTAAPTDGVAVAVALDAPTSAFDATASPDGINPAVALDAPSTSFDTTASPDGIAVAVALDAPTASIPIDTAPSDGITVAVALDAPTGAFSASATPDGINPPVALDPPDAAFTLNPVTAADGPAVPVALDAPTATFDVPAALDFGLAVPIGWDQPTAAFTADPATLTDGITVDVALDPPDAVVLTHIDAVLTNGIRVPLHLDGPAVDKTTAVQYVDPLVPPRPLLVATAPYHLMGVGPAQGGIPWRGAPNYGVGAAGTTVTLPSWPTIDMPDAQSKSFTLRLNAASEARTEHDFARYDAIVIEEMVTDLWWRRRDPNRNVVDVIGRFNAAHADVASTDMGIQLSASWMDYQAILEDRLVLKYLHPELTPPESQWAIGTTVNEILRFAIPDNTGIDLSAIAVGSAAIATIKTPFELPPGTPISDVMKNLQAISSSSWEWWVEMPTSNASRPVLSFAAQRGSDNGITLFEIGSGTSPITSWTMKTATDQYANAVFFSGSEGGVVYQYDADISIYGQRDATDSDSSLKGNIALIQAAAQKRLAELADRTPTWSLNLRTGFWEGRTHIDIGDWITVQVRLGADVIAGKHRVAEIQVEVDASGFERVSLVLGTPRPAADPRSRNSAIARLVRRLKNYERRGT